MLYSDILDKIDSSIFIVLITILVPVFELGMSFEKVKPGKSPEKVWKKSGNLYSKLRRSPAYGTC